MLLFDSHPWRNGSAEMWRKLLRNSNEVIFPVLSCPQWSDAPNLYFSVADKRWFNFISNPNNRSLVQAAASQRRQTVSFLRWHHVSESEPVQTVYVWLAAVWLCYAEVERVYGCYVKKHAGCRTNTCKLSKLYIWKKKKSCRFVFSGMTEPLSDMLGISVATDPSEDVQRW